MYIKNLPIPMNLNEFSKNKKITIFKKVPKMKNKFAQRSPSKFFLNILLPVGVLIDFYLISDICKPI